jgi:UDP-N-acetylmuramate dehydrogenase
MSIKVIDNYDLSGHNTFGFKVSCAQFIDYNEAEELPQIFQQQINGKKYLHIGGGSNLLFTKDYDGVVLHSSIKSIETISEDADNVTLKVGAGVTLDDLIEQVSERGLWGIENLSDIPGEMGAAAVQNVGAYGVEIKDVVMEVSCYDTVDKQFKTIQASECGYGYRQSLFKQADVKGRYIITHVTIKLSKKACPKVEYGNIAKHLPKDGKIESPKELRDIIIKIRREKLPIPSETGSAGSFFKNPVISAEAFEALTAIASSEVPHYITETGYKVPAAWLIDQCGWKGKTLGNAGVWHKQPLVLVNATGNARPEEIINLENQIIASVKERFEVTLEPEVEHV